MLNIEDCKIGAKIICISDDDSRVDIDQIYEIEEVTIDGLFKIKGRKSLFGRKLFKKI